MTIGFDRKILADWLDATARMAARGLSVAEARCELDEVLKGQVSGEGPHSALGKTKTVLVRIWVTPPPHTAALRDDAIAFVRDGEPDLRPLHWGMCLTAYPFFAEVAAITGRLLSLQSSAALAAVNRRVSERFGSRSTAIRAAQRVVRSMVEWGVLAETAERGVYRSEGASQGGGTPELNRIEGWLLEAALVASGRRAMRLGALVRHPMLFPFDLAATIRDVAERPRLELFREGSGEDVVGLRYRALDQAGASRLLGQ